MNEESDKEEDKCRDYNEMDIPKALSSFLLYFLFLSLIKLTSSSSLRGRLKGRRFLKK